MTIQDHPLKELPGLSADHQAALANLGFSTTTQLYRYGQTEARQLALAQRLQLPRRYVQKWVILAGLARVPGVGCQFNGLLLHAGITSVEQLAQTSAQRLAMQVKRLHVATLRRNDLSPTPDQVNLWINHARALATPAQGRGPGNPRRSTP
jgi:hypothetical protein